MANHCFGLERVSADSRHSGPSQGRGVAAGLKPVDPVGPLDVPIVAQADRLARVVGELQRSIGEAEADAIGAVRGVSCGSCVGASGCGEEGMTRARR